MKRRGGSSSSGTPAEGQRLISSFFKKQKAPAPPSSSADDDRSVVVVDDDDDPGASSAAAAQHGDDVGTEELSTQRDDAQAPKKRKVNEPTTRDDAQAPKKGTAKEPPARDAPAPKMGTAKEPPARDAPAPKTGTEQPLTTVPDDAAPGRAPPSAWTPSYVDDEARRRAVRAAVVDGPDDDGAAAQDAAAPAGAPTPLHQQVLTMQRQFPGTLLVTEVGYKYRVFGDDAVDAAKILGLVAWRDKALMSCSFPTGRLGVHVRRLVAAGRKVGVVRQTETAALKAAGKTAAGKSGTFSRGLSRTFSPATLLDDLDAELGLQPPAPPGGDDDDDDDPGGDDGAPPDAAAGALDDAAERWIWCGVVRAGVVGVVAVELRRSRAVVEAFDRGDADRLADSLHRAPPTEALLGRSLPAALRGRVRAANAAATPHRAEDVDDADEDDAAGAGTALHAAAARRGGAALAALAVLRDFVRKARVESALDGVTDISGRGVGGDGVGEPGESPAAGPPSKTMALDAATLQDLEVLRASDGSEKGSVLSMCARGTCTRGGVDVLREWLRAPLCDVVEIGARQRGVAHFAAGGRAASGGDALAGLAALLAERSAVATVARALEKPLAALAARRIRPKRLLDLFDGGMRLLRAMPDAAALAVVSGGAVAEALQEAVGPIAAEREYLLAELKRRRSALNVEGCGKDVVVDALLCGDASELEAFGDLVGANERISAAEAALDGELDAVRRLVKKPSLEWKSLRSGTSVTEFLVELPRAQAVDGKWACVSETKAVRRYHTPRVPGLTRALEVARDERAVAATAAWHAFVVATDGAVAARLRGAARALAVVDAYHSLGCLAGEPGWCMPDVVDADAPGAVGTTRLEIFSHPTLPPQRGDDGVDGGLVANTVALRPNECLILTGPNMGGKSSFARAIALTSILAQCGAPVFAARATLRAHDAIFTRMGASDDLTAGKSTFLCELERAALAVNGATARSLVVLDELGRGTSTYDGVAIANAVLDHLVKRVRCAAVFITHYHELAAAAESDHPEHVTNKHMAFQRVGRTVDGEDDTIVMLYKVENGLAPESFGLHAARVAGLPGAVLDLAKANARALAAGAAAR
ncbi:muts domain V-domain-containing protein [Pelagophyceae sp. CCMP2097]|nr:muts domain V-domain-containing protein [Pelagophyceae sp. CCMP2097]